MEKNKKNEGYTIIETMIAVSLFLIVIMTGMGALLNANSLHQKSENMRSIVDNLSFIIEDISRNLRTGYHYRCIAGLNDLAPAKVGVAQSGQNCLGIAFEYANGNPGNNNDQWVYYVDNGQIFKSVQGPYIPSTFIQLTPDEVVVDTNVSGFSVLGAEGMAKDSQQPFVTIRLVGAINFKEIVTPFSLQTSVSQRLIDI